MVPPPPNPAFVGLIMDEESKSYFLHREQIEREAAERATSSAARRVHQQLAQGYAKLMRSRLASGHQREEG